jgi:hypothetical protein
MSGVENDPNHCFECDSEDVALGSLKPQRVTNILKTIPNGRNTQVDVPRSSSDFNVCTPCYLKQYAEVYLGDPLPEV